MIFIPFFLGLLPGCGLMVAAIFNYQIRVRLRVAVALQCSQFSVTAVLSMEQALDRPRGRYRVELSPFQAEHKGKTQPRTFLEKLVTTGYEGTR